MDTVVILAGGKSRRMGRDKLTLTIEGLPLLDFIVSRFSGHFGNVYISVADADKYSRVKAEKIVDIFHGAGPMSGLHAALTKLPGEGIFLVAADLPNANPNAAKRIVELCGDCEACVIRLPDGKLEPLFGYYKKSVLPKCSELIESGDYRMTELILGSNTRYISTDELGSLWSEKLIYNINYPEDYDRL